MFKIFDVQNEKEEKEKKVVTNTKETERETEEKIGKTREEKDRQKEETWDQSLEQQLLRHVPLVFV